MKKKKKVKNKTKRKILKKKRKPVRSIKKKVSKKPKKKVVKRKKKKTSNVKGAKKTFMFVDASLEEVGTITHYFSHVEAAVIKLTKGSLSLGDTIVIKGHTTEFKEKIDSLQMDHVSITTAHIGQEIGLKVKKKVREHDVVYRLIA